jgi:hypothetical protein
MCPILSEINPEPNAVPFSVCRLDTKGVGTLLVICTTEPSTCLNIVFRVSVCKFKTRAEFCWATGAGADGEPVKNPATVEGAIITIAITATANALLKHTNRNFRTPLLLTYYYVIPIT